MRISGRFPSRIVPTATPSTISAFIGVEGSGGAPTSNRNVSPLSPAPSSTVRTYTVANLAPGTKVWVPSTSV